MKKLVLLFVGVLFFAFHAVSQVKPAGDSTRVVDILNADKLRTEKKDSIREVQIGTGHIRALDGKTLFECDSFYYDKSTKTFEAFGNVHINDNDSVNIYSQYLLYHVDTRMADLQKAVKLTDGKSTLTTQKLTYDLNQKIGNYYEGGKVLTGKSVLTSQEGTYYADLKDVYFKKNVVLIDPQYKLRSDSLLYNTETQLTTFITKTFIEDSTRNVETSEGYYDVKNRKAVFGKRPIIKDGATTVIADDVQSDDSSGISILTGNAVYKDTVQGVAIIANYINANKKENTVLATQKPLMIIKQEADSLYITADTLYSGRLSKLYGADSTLKDTIKGVAVVPASKENDSTDRYFQAFHHVRIFSDSLQAVSDSLFYSGKDSIFKLFKDPIVWASNSQITGDTIYLYTKNKKAERMYVWENGIAINKTGEKMFNQVKGNRMNGYFKEGVIDYMRAQGNAESVYYVKDKEESLVGINRVGGDIIDMRFLNKELNRVVVISDVKGTMYPANQTPDTEKTLRNFKWRDELRPKTKFELFGY
jgi:lipopolysaccharide export system protein LptA